MFGPKISTLCKEGEKGIVPKCTKTCSERFGECPLFSIHWAQGLNPLKRLPPSIDGHASIHRRGHLYPWARRRLSMAEHVPMDGAHGDTPRMIPGLQGGTAVRPQPRLPACNGRDRRIGTRRKVAVVMTEASFPPGVVIARKIEKEESGARLKMR